jgi:hypothetical protein
MLTCTNVIVINKCIGPWSFVFMFYMTSSTMICYSSFISQSNLFFYVGETWSCTTQSFKVWMVKLPNWAKSWYSRQLVILVTKYNK